MGVSLGVDLSDLDICFGGFAPTLMIDTVQALDRAEEAEERLRVRRESLERAAAAEAARASEPRIWVDGDGTRWTFVLLDGVAARIERCDPAVADLRIPDKIEGIPVVALADDACAQLSGLRSVIVPDPVVSIGYCAFRGCPDLQRAALSCEGAEYDPGWFRNCPKLEDLVLPGRLDQVRPNVFDNTGLKRLRIGAGTRSIYPGTFGKGALDVIEVDPQNPYLETDGIAVYTKGRAGLVAMAVAMPSYEVAPDCIAVGRKAANGMAQLERITLPDGIEMIAEHAFAHTGLHTFAAPSALQSIAERAFFDCPCLDEVHLNEGLRSIGEHAFTRTALTALHLPSTVEQIGHPVAADAFLVYAGERATFTIAEGSDLRIDEQGALLRICKDGLHLEWMADPRARRLRVPEGVVSIDARALLNHKALEEVEVPRSVRDIGPAAFRGCIALRRIVLSEGLQRIGDEAFLDTVIEALHLPASLEGIGLMALVVADAHSGRAATSLREVSVDPGNARFAVRSGMLLEVGGDGRLHVVHYMDTEPDVIIGREVASIAPYAFSGARHLRSLMVHSSLTDIGIRAFAVDRLIELIRIDMDEPVQGHDSFEIRFPATDRGEHQQFVALTSGAGLDARNLMEHYDNAIANVSNFDAVLNGRGLSLYDQAVRIIERLGDPVFLTDVNRQLLERIIRQQLGDVCAAIAKHDDRASLDALADLGFLNADNMNEVIERVSAVRDAAMTGYLLEMRRCRFGCAALDFEL